MNEEQKKAFLAEIQQKIDQASEKRASPEQVNELKKQLDEFLKDLDPVELRSILSAENGVVSKLAAQALKIKEIEQKLSGQSEDLSVRGQIKKYFADNENVIREIRSGLKRDLPPMMIRAVESPMLPSTVMPNGKTYLTSTTVDRNIVSPLLPETNFWNALPKGSTGSETYVWINRTPTEGEPGWIAPGVYKPAISFDINAEISNAKKIAANEKFATELLEDLEGFNSWVELTLREALDQKLNTTFFASVGSTTSPKGVSNYGVPYSLTGLKTANPNIWDAIKATVTELKLKHHKGPFITVLNPVDYANAVMTKAVSQGQLFIAPALGTTIVEDTQVDVGKVLTYDVKAYKVLVYKGIQIKFGWEKDDFTRNLVTAIIEMRAHQFVSKNHETTFAVYDDLATIILAIDETTP